MTLTEKNVITLNCDTFGQRIRHECIALLLCTYVIFQSTVRKQFGDNVTNELLLFNVKQKVTFQKSNLQLNAWGSQMGRTKDPELFQKCQFKIKVQRIKTRREIIKSIHCFEYINTYVIKLKQKVVYFVVKLNINCVAQIIIKTKQGGRWFRLNRVSFSNSKVYFLKQACES